MESVVGLRSSTFPIPSVRIPSGFHSARATNTQLGLSHSSLSFLRTFSDGSPLGHKIGPILCIRHGSLHRGTENVPWTSRFPCNFGRSSCSKRKASEGRTPQPGTDKERESQQLQILIKRQQLRDRQAAQEILKGLGLYQKVNEKDGFKVNRTLHNNIMEIVNQMKKAGYSNVAVEILKEYEPFAAAYAVDEGLQSVQAVQSQLMTDLQTQRKYQEAFQYWSQLCCNEESPQLHMGLKAQYGLLFSMMTDLSKCLKNKDGNLLKKVNETVQTLEELRKGNYGDFQNIENNNGPSD